MSMKHNEIKDNSCPIEQSFRLKLIFMILSGRFLDFPVNGGSEPKSVFYKNIREFVISNIIDRILYRI